VTPAKKILLAAAFVAAGYGVASLLGAPKLQIIRRTEPLASRAPAPKPDPEPRTAPPNALSDAGARLVPDLQPPSASATVDNNLEDVLRDHFENRSQNEFELASVSAPHLTDGAAAASPLKTQFVPRASLRNEAPRPIIVGPREQITLKDVSRPAVIGASLAHEGAPSGVAVYSAPNDVSQTLYSHDVAPSVETAPNADVDANRVTIDGYVAQPPPMHNSLEDQSRSHIVVDGDSLAKLADRYLNDSQRASEIYELNRHVLSHPDVLPIGAELAIPPRSASLHSNGQPPQSLLPHAPALHAASRGGLVPVRPVPPGAAVMPRAHLARPRPVAGTLRVP
jgi:nucleoid-associated protein YgaU